MEIYIDVNKTEQFADMISWANENKKPVYYVADHVMSALSATKNSAGHSCCIYDKA